MGRSLQTHFFATRADMAPGIERIESERRLQYVLCDEYEVRQPRAYSSLLEVGDLGTNRTGKAIDAPMFLVMDDAEPLMVQPIERPGGGTRYAVTQEGNPRSIVIASSGLYQETTLVAGKVATVSEHSGAIALYKLFVRELTRGFKKIRRYLVGPQALRMLDEGGRLVTIGVRSPAEYDLRR